MATIIKHVDAYDRARIKEAVNEALAALGGVERLFKNREHLLLKPNLVLPEQVGRHSTTDPRFYVAVAELFLDHGKRVSLGDSPAFGSAKGAVRRHEAQDELARLGVEVVNFNTPIPCTGVSTGRRFRELTVAGELCGFDCLINLPKLKVHQQFVFSAAVKNLYGCVSGKRKAYRHLACCNDRILFAGMLLANLKAVEEVLPVVTISDGIAALHVKGPRGGQPYPLHNVFVSDSCLEHDWLFCQRVGIDQHTAPLFGPLTDTQRAELAAACCAAVAAPGFAVAQGFILANEVPIGFSVPQIVRSLYRSWQLGRVSK